MKPMTKFIFLFCYILSEYCNSTALAQSENLKKTNLHFFDQTEVGGFYAHGVGFTAQTVNGVIWKNHYCLGGGIGVLSKEIYSLPLFLHGQYELDNGGITTFFYGDLGFNAAVGSNTTSYDSPGELSNGGLMSALGFGMKSQTKYHIVISLGYIYSKVKATSHYFGGSKTEIVFIKNNGPSLRVGIGF